MNVKDYAVIGVGAALLYAVVQVGRKIGGAAGAVGDALTKTGETIGEKIYTLFHPDVVGESLFYTVTFPDGKRHSVPSRSVSQTGQFWYPATNGKKYQLLVDKATGYKVAKAL